MSRRENERRGGEVKGEGGRRKSDDERKRSKKSEKERGGYEEHKNREKKEIRERETKRNTKWLSGVIEIKRFLEKA